MGRPSKLTPETQERIVQAIQLGATYEQAANYGGIAYETFNSWRNRAQAEIERRQKPRVQEGSQQWETEEPYVQFLQAIKDAEGRAVVGWLAKIELAATNGNWQAAAWKLERRYPADYGRQRHEITGAGGGPVPVQVTTVEIVRQGDND